MYEIDKIFNEIENEVFGKPTRFYFSTPNTYDRMPAHWSKWTEEVKKEDSEETETKDLGYFAVCRTVGIDPEDIKVSLEEYGIHVEGETEVEGTTYSTKFDLPITKSLISNIVSIDYKCKNGLTYIYLKMQEPEYKKVEIKRI